MKQRERQEQRHQKRLRVFLFLCVETLIKMFIWTRVSHVSGRYHHSGGLIVTADTLDSARIRVKELNERVNKGADEPGECGALTEEPDYVVDVPEGTDIMEDFPDAGCC